MGCNSLSQRSSEFLVGQSTILLPLSPDEDIFANHKNFPDNNNTPGDKIYDNIFVK